MTHMTQAELALIEQRKMFANLAKLPPLLVTLQELEDLPEYSATLPTGTTPGKRWRKEINCTWFAYTRAGGKTAWMIGEYDPNDDGKGPSIKINWYRPVIRVPAQQVICVDKEQQRMFMLDQVYAIAGMTIYNTPPWKARDRAKELGYDIPYTHELYPEI